MRPQHEYEEVDRWLRWGMNDCLFTNESEDIRELFWWACDLFLVRWRKSKRNTISIARAPDVARLDLVIGPKA